MTNRRPLVLFDGVCNLCNAAVQRMIAWDPNARLTFASLQSEAAAAALEAAGVDDPAALPDSFVLIDDRGVHVRSSAALRIAGWLGFPYKLAMAALMVPRPIRDAVYRFVARNRYRWFGRQDTCMMPTPDLAARFVDADEPRPVIPSTEVPREERSVVRAWFVRLAIAYVIIYMLPFPFTLLSYIGRLPLLSEIPGFATVLNWIPAGYGLVMNPFTEWVGSAVFGVDASFQVTGSGDRTFNYVMLFIQAVVALIVATVWTVLVRARRLSPRVFDGSRVLARYYLATTMLTYGWVKIFPLQMPAPGPDRLLQPYGDSSPMGLVWTFIGASVGYQIFSGLCEALGGYLLFWRRTAFAGALVTIAVMANVMAINFFYDVPVKLFSTHIVLVAIFVAAPDLPRLFGFLGFNLPIAPADRPPFWTALGRRAHVLTVAHLALIGTITAFHVTDNLRNAETFGFRMERPAITGIWQVESFELGGLVGRENEDEIRWVRVGLNPPNVATVQRATGIAERMRIQWNGEDGTISFFDRGGQAPAEPQFDYSEHPDGSVELVGTFQGEEARIVLRRSEEGALLLERGYNWINEFPFNR